jgi:hypothetical protein
MSNRIGVIFCLNILLVLAKSRVNGMDIWEWVIFVLQVVLNMLPRSVSSSSKFGTHITVSVTSFSKGGGEIGTTFFDSFVLGINILTRGSLGGGVSYHYPVLFFLGMISYQCYERP